MDVLSTYKFYIAMENSNAVDYVTEKIFHAFSAGVVPSSSFKFLFSSPPPSPPTLTVPQNSHVFCRNQTVYLGAPNIRDFLPSNKSAILTSDFDSPEELAKYIKELNEDDAKYNEYLEWKQPGRVADSFMELVATQKLDARCRLCILVKERKNAAKTSQVATQDTTAEELGEVKEEEEKKEKEVTELLAKDVADNHETETETNATVTEKLSAAKEDQQEKEKPLGSNNDKVEEQQQVETTKDQDHQNETELS
jgi:hypothetical protein